MTEHLLIRNESIEPKPARLRENALRAHAVVADGLAGRLRGRPGGMDSLRERFAPSLTPRGFPRSRVFTNVIREASIAVVCALAFACNARDRGLADSRLAGRPLLERALGPGIDPPSASGDHPALWRELKAMLVSFHDGTTRNDRPALRRDGGSARRATHTRPFSPLLYDLPPEIELPDGVLKTALGHLRGAYDSGNKPARKERSRRQSPALDLASAPIRSIGDVYEALVRGTGPGSKRNAAGREKTSRRKVTGMYYTPDVIVRHIVSRTLGRLVGISDDGASPVSESLSVHEILNLKVLDPASGSGHFLLAAAEYLAQACVAGLIRDGEVRDEGLDRSEAIKEYRKLVAARCICGVDIDPVAVELAGLSLWLFASDPDAPLSQTTKHLRCGNSLHRFDWAGEFPDAARGFDAVIGNPPYLSFSGRQKPGGNEWIRKLGPNSKPGGWLSMHGLFMLKSMELAKGSGLVSMVVPDQVGHLKGYEPLRSRMLEEGRLLEVKYWGEGVFEGVSSPALTFIVRKSGGTSGDDTEETLMIDADGNAECFSPLAGQEWFTSAPLKTVRRMSEIHSSITGFSDPGVHTGNVALKLVLKRPSEGSVPLLEGRQVHPFHCEEPRRWLDLSYKPGNGEYFRVSAQETYRSIDIVLRQTASSPIAARHVHRCHFRNSVLALKVPEGVSIEYILGVLNSGAAAFLYRASSFESRQRAFPQIKVGLLRGLPIPDPLLRKNRSRVSEIEEIVRRVESVTAPGDTPAELLSELDILVWSLYGLEGAPPAI